MRFIDEFVRHRHKILASLMIVAAIGPACSAEGLGVRAARLERFDGFLGEAAALYAKAGARTEPVHPRYGYENADLIDPMIVTSELRHALERYASYRAMIRAEIPSRAAAVTFGRPPGSHTPEDFDPAVMSGQSDATTAIEKALAAGNLWLTPGRVYRVSHPILVPSDRTIASDGTGTIFVSVGGAGFPQERFDLNRSRSSSPNVFQIHDDQHVTLSDFRLQTPIADLHGPQSILHGIDIQNADHVVVIGLEIRGFPRSQGIVRINSSTDVRIEDNLIHASYTRLLTRQVTGIEVDEARIRPAPGRPPRNSDHVEINGNFILGLLLDAAVYLETSLRGGKPLNDETTGIYLGAKESGETIAVNGNVIADVGQGLDLAVSNGHFADNIIERASEYGLKIGHSASHNRFDNFVIRASGIAAVTIYSVPDEPAIGNRISNLTIDHPGSVAGLPGRTSYGITVTALGGPNGEPPMASTMSGNAFNEVTIGGQPAGDTDGWGGAIYCRWPATRPAGVVAPNSFQGLRPASVDVISIGGCAGRSTGV